MRARRQPAGPSPKDYRSMAIGVLALALVAGVMVSNDAPEPAGQKVAVQFQPPGKARHASAFALGEQSSQEEPGETGETGAAHAPAALPAPLPAPGDPAARSVSITRGPASTPDPAQIERLIGASRARSGGVDQGDEGRPL